MTIKKFLKISIVTMAVFISYIFSIGINNSYHISNDSIYKLDTYNITSSNKWASFLDKKDGHLFIHPGENNVSKGIFHFKVDTDVIWDFHIEKNYYGAKIGIVLKHNGKLLKSFKLTMSNPTKIHMKISSGDSVEIIADKLEDTTNDHCQLSLYTKINYLDFKYYLVPLLWSLFIVFFFYKGYGYLAINSYLLFLLLILAERLNFGIIFSEQIIQYMFLVYALSILFVVLYKKFTYLTIPFSFLIIFLLSIIPLMFIIYILNFDIPITKDIIYAVFQTNPNESYEYVSDFIDIKYILLLVVAICIGVILCLYQIKQKMKKINTFILLIMFGVSIFIGLQHQNLLRLPSFIVQSFNEYMHEVLLFKKVQQERDLVDIDFNATKNTNGETYIVIIGESLNKHHMGIYGYLRDTTPKLSKYSDLILFDNVYSNHVHTVPVLSYALTEANQYNHKKYYSSLSIIDVLKKADFETYWLTNQVLYGAWDNMVSVIGTSADHLFALNKSIGTNISAKHYDGDLIKKLKEILKLKTEKNRVIFVHLYGNHQLYKERYPQKFDIYKRHLQKGRFGIKAVRHSDNINAYDNSVRYNDYVVSSILMLLQQQNTTSGFLYFSDHADDVVNHLAHSIDRFTFEMTQIPMIAWFSQGYKDKYIDRYKSFLNRKDTLFSNDMIYDTLLGMMDVHTNRYNPKFDLSSTKYNLEFDKALVNHGKKYYATKENYLHWQKYNIDKSKKTKLMIAHIKTLSVLKDILHKGLESIDFDLYYNQKGFLYTSSTQGDLEVLKLSDILSYISNQKVRFIKLNIKNLKASNINQVIDRLDTLNDIFHIKSKVLLSLNSSQEIFKLFEDNGWKTIYHIKAYDLIEEKCCQKIIQSRADTVLLSSYIYDDFTNLSKGCDLDDIKYMVDDVPALSDSSFMNKLEDEHYYKDKKVISILTTYKSQFD